MARDGGEKLVDILKIDEAEAIKHAAEGELKKWLTGRLILNKYASSLINKSISWGVSVYI